MQSKPSFVYRVLSETPVLRSRARPRDARIDELTNVIVDNYPHVVAFEWVGHYKNKNGVSTGLRASINSRLPAGHKVKMNITEDTAYITLLKPEGVD